MGIVVLICPITTCKSLADALASIRAHNAVPSDEIGPRSEAEMDPRLRTMLAAIHIEGAVMLKCNANTLYTRGEDMHEGGVLVRDGKELWLEVSSGGGGHDSLTWLRENAPQVGWTRPMFAKRSHDAFMKLPMVAKSKREDMAELFGFIAAEAATA
jgi:hypothetical protein